MGICRSCLSLVVFWRRIPIRMVTVTVKEANDTIMGSVQCLNALPLAPKSDCIEMNRRGKMVKKWKNAETKIYMCCAKYIEGTHFFYKLKVWKIKYNWFCRCASENKNLCFWHSKKSILFPHFIIHYVARWFCTGHYNHFL